MTFSAMSLFCEDIRNEIRGIETLVGLLPDTMIVQGNPGPGQGLPKVCVFTRINLPPKPIPSLLSVKFFDPNDNLLGENIISRDILAESFAEAGNMPSVGVKVQAVIGNFPIIPGIFRVVVECDGEKILSGALNMRVEATDVAVKAST